MIRATASLEGPLFSFNATVSGLAVYLDNWAVIELARGDPSRRRRFVETLRSGGDLLFSVTNAAELSGPQGNSANIVRNFLNEIGPHWFPVELDPFEVVKREQNGDTSAGHCICKRFMKDYFADQFRDCTPASGRIIDLSQDALRLGPVMDWVGPQRDSIRQGSADFDDALIKRIIGYRAEYLKNNGWLDETFPILSFRADMPATFGYISLIRTLILESTQGYQLKKGDGLDFCHAVMASAFASVAALDKHWQRRIGSLPKPNGLAPIYSGLELDKMVMDIESSVIPAIP
jgi:hypothetical protein